MWSSYSYIRLLQHALYESLNPSSCLYRCHQPYGTIRTAHCWARYWSMTVWHRQALRYHPHPVRCCGNIYIRACECPSARYCSGRVGRCCVIAHSALSVVCTSLDSAPKEIESERNFMIASIMGCARTSASVMAGGAAYALIYGMGPVCAGCCGACGAARSSTIAVGKAVRSTMRCNCRWIAMARVTGRFKVCRVSMAARTVLAGRRRVGAASIENACIREELHLGMADLADPIYGCVSVCE